MGDVAEPQTLNPTLRSPRNPLRELSEHLAQACMMRSRHQSKQAKPLAVYPKSSTSGSSPEALKPPHVPEPIPYKQNLDMRFVTHSQSATPSPLRFTRERGDSGAGWGGPLHADTYSSLTSISSSSSSSSSSWMSSAASHHQHHHRRYSHRHDYARSDRHHHHHHHHHHQHHPHHPHHHQQQNRRPVDFPAAFLCRPMSCRRTCCSASRSRISTLSVLWSSKILRLLKCEMRPWRL